MAIVGLGKASLKIGNAGLSKLDDHFVSGPVLLGSFESCLLFLVRLGQCFDLLLILLLLDVHILQVLCEQLLHFANTIFHLLQLSSSLLIHPKSFRVLLLESLHPNGRPSGCLLIHHVK